MLPCKEIPYSLLSDIAKFSKVALGLPLYDYQLRPLYSIIESIQHGYGREFLLLFSRQSGKNEAMAQLLAYMLNVRRRKGGNMVFAATGDGLGRGMRRLEERLNNPYNRDEWQKTGQPSRCVLGDAAVVFLSSHPQAASRGETADHLLIVDEMQDQQRSHIEAVFTPMRAAGNATAVYLGTARSQHDALWLKKLELEERTRLDGLERVFTVGPEEIVAVNPIYGSFLEEQVRQHGRHHPIIASEYFLEPMGSDAGLFPARRRALMHGEQCRQRHPSGEPVIALLDVGGQDEGATDPVARLENPARDYTVCTIVELVSRGGAVGRAALRDREADAAVGRTVGNAPEMTAAATDFIYRAVDVFTDQGSRHFESGPGHPSLAERLLAYLEHWRVDHLICDATGVGEGLASWLAERLGASRVTPFKFSAPSKAALGAAFLALIETGRFKYWGDDTEEEGSDGWWFWEQAKQCSYELPPGGQFERHLRWTVPTSARISTPSGMQPVHDDRLISAALVAEAERLMRLGKINFGQAKSAVIRSADPLDLSW